MYLTKTVNGVEICYDQAGFACTPPIVLVSGWAHDMRLYDRMVPLLVPKHTVVRINWRGHSINRDYEQDFGVEEQVADTIAMLKALGIDKFYLVAHSHGGWPALELADSLGKDRVLALLMIDQIMTAPPPPFQKGLMEIQDPKTWNIARQSLFENWLAGSTNEHVIDHIAYSMGSFGYHMWSLSCKVIEKAYATHTSPMSRMKKITNPPPIRHVFSHPLESQEYRKIHEDFAKENSWFSYKDVEGETHFPSVEVPESVVQQLEDLITSASA